MATSSVKLFSPYIVAHTGKRCTASVILLHGSGGTGEDLNNSFQYFLGGEFNFPHIRFIYPSAPVRPYTLTRGLPCSVWFDRQSLGLDAKELTESVDATAMQLSQLVDQEISSGIPPHRILIGGFSMGGAMAFHLGYRFHPHVAGVLVMSGFLSDDSSVYKQLQTHDQTTRVPPLQQFHGEDDDLVLHDWGRVTHSKLKKLGVKAEFVSIPNLTHVMNGYMAKSARDWIAKVLPEDPNL